MFFLKLRYIKKNKIKLFKKNYFKFKEKYFFKINLKNKFKLFNYYNHYNNSFFFKKNFNNIKYEKLLTFIILKKVKILHLNVKFFDINNILILNNFILLYNFFLNSIYIDIFYFTKFLKIKNRILFYLTFSFKKKKLYINLQNKKKKNYISISTGLFIKFFEKRKSIKKNKAIKLLMAKYLRKLFIISKINNLILVIKKTPLFINELINFLNTPIAHKFLNPIDQKIVDESINKNLSIRFLYFIFMENKNFSKNKIASKGRIKRKILRKITFENRIID